MKTSLMAEEVQPEMTFLPVALILFSLKYTLVCCSKRLIAWFLLSTDTEMMYILKPLDQTALSVLNSDNPGCNDALRHQSLQVLKS